MDFTENRFRGYCDRVLSGDILCETGNEDETCFQRHTGWYPDHASGTSPDSAGFILLLLFSLRRPFGAFLLDNFDIKIVQTWKGCVIAASVIAFPLMYRNARAAFEQVDVNLIAAGKTLGMSDRRIFWTVVMPTAGPGIASGTVLAFARAIGEYGATSMLAGNILGKTRTVSVAIASETAAGNYAWPVSGLVVILIISFVIVAAINIVSGKGMKMGRWM